MKDITSRNKKLSLKFKSRMKERYTKEQLEQIIYYQLEHINALNDLVQAIKDQNELIEQVNKRLKKKLLNEKLKLYPKLTRK